MAKEKEEKKAPTFSNGFKIIFEGAKIHARKVTIKRLEE